MKRTDTDTQNTGLHAGREANFELLRIVAMGMVIVLHYLGKGGFLTETGKMWGGADYLAWLLEAFCVVAVDVYVLISGWFLTDSTWKPEKLVRLWMQIFFYSAGIPAVLFFTGFLPGEEMKLERLVTWVFPVLREHYWFATAYVILYLLAPFLGGAVRQLSKKQLEQLLVILLGIFSVSKSILPVDLPLDTGGYDVLWFLCLFLTAAYLRLYGVPFFGSGRSRLAGYAVCSTAIFGMMCLYRAISRATGHLEGFAAGPYQYNHILCFLAAVFLFLFFEQVRLPQGKWNGYIVRAASCTFGIYLFHENEVLRYLWPKWLFAEQWKGTYYVIAGAGMAVAFWYAAGILVEVCRQKIMRLIFRK